MTQCGRRGQRRRAQAQGVATVSTRSGQVLGRTKGVPDEAVHEVLSRHTGRADYSDGGDAVERDGSTVEARLKPVPRDEMESEVGFGLGKARNFLPGKVASGILNLTK